MAIQNFFAGLLAVVIGVVSLKYNYQLVGFTGRQDWIESKLGSGSTYLAYKMLSVLLVVGGLIFAVGLGSKVEGWLLAPLANLLDFKHN